MCVVFVSVAATAAAVAVVDVACDLDVFCLCVVFACLLFPPSQTEHILTHEQHILRAEARETRRYGYDTVLI